MSDANKQRAEQMREEAAQLRMHARARLPKERIELTELEDKVREARTALETYVEMADAKRVSIQTLEQYFDRADVIDKRAAEVEACPSEQCKISAP